LRAGLCPVWGSLVERNLLSRLFTFIATNGRKPLANCTE
jgi:hypothetical protein